MSHHSGKPNSAPLIESIRRVLEQPLIGATGTHPEGHLNKDDEGGIQFAVGIKDGKVVIDFGTPVAWMGMNPGDALALAQVLIEKARAAAKGSGSILTLNI